MNTRILRMCERAPIGHIRHVRDLGQLQPVLFGFERGRVTLRIEIAERGRPAWGIYPLPWTKKVAKKAFAALEKCKHDGTRSAAWAVWAAREAR